MDYTCCSLCGQDNPEHLFAARGEVRGSDEQTNIVRCRECGFVYINPRVESDRIGEYYPAESYSPYQETSESQSIGGRLKMLARQSVPGYGKNLGPFDRLLSKTLGPVFLKFIDIVVPFRENGRILDVGCANGKMIGWMRDFGWQTYGVDIGDRALESARRKGLEVFCGQLEDAHYEDGYFDVITMSHVIEHLYDPLSIIRECFRILKDDGLLIIVCPNFGCYDSGLFKESFFQIDTPRHVNHFTRATLGRLLRDAGFEVDRWKFKPPMPMFDRSSFRLFRQNHPDIGFGGLLSLRMKASLVKALGYTFGSNRGERFSRNIAAYAIKRRDA